LLSSCSLAAAVPSFISSLSLRKLRTRAWRLCDIGLAYMLDVGRADEVTKIVSVAFIESGACAHM
jgi:hypothetical protein